MDNREAALAVHPPPVPREDLHIVKHGGLVEPDTSAVDRPSELDLGRVEVVKGGLVQNLGRLVAEDVDNRLRGKQDVGIGREVCTGERLDQPSVRPGGSTSSDLLTVDGHKRLILGIHGF